MTNAQEVRSAAGRHLASVAVFAAVALLGLLGCGGRQANNTTKLRVGMVTFPGYAPLYVARELQLFRGVDVELLRIESISDLRAAQKAGRIDIYLATYDIFQSTMDEPPGVGFLAVDESHGADGIAAVSSVATVADLKGREVAVEPGFPPHFILQYALHKAGLTLRDVKLKDMASQDAGTAFAAGHFSVVGTYEPYLTKAIESRAKRDGAKLLMSSKDAPGLIVDFAFADTSVVRSKREALIAFAQGWFDAVAHIQQNESADMAIMARAFSVTPEEMKAFHSVVSWLDLARNRELFDRGLAGNAYATFDSVGAVLDANGSRGGKYPAASHLTSAIIDALRPK